MSKRMPNLLQIAPGPRPKFWRVSDVAFAQDHGQICITVKGCDDVRGNRVRPIRAVYALKQTTVAPRPALTVSDG